MLANWFALREDGGGADVETGRNLIHDELLELLGVTENCEKPFRKFPLLTSTIASGCNAHDPGFAGMFSRAAEYRWYIFRQLTVL